MIQAFAILLLFQLFGEIFTRALGLSLPGPVVGMAALFIAFLISSRLHSRIEPTAKGLLSHLSLLFVPAGVGIVGHLDKLGDDGLPLLLAIVGSTVAAIAVGAITFVAVARLTGGRG